MKDGKVCSVSQTASTTRPTRGRSAAQMPDRHADQHAQDDRGGDGVERHQRLDPQAAQDDEAGEQRHAQGQAGAAQAPAGEGHEADGHGPGCHQDRVAQGQQHVGGEAVAHRSQEPVEVDGHPADEPIPEGGGRQRELVRQGADGWDDHGQQDAGGNARQRQDQVRMAPPADRSLGLAARVGLADPVQDHRQHHDRHALLDRLADPQLLQREHQLLAEPDGADQRGDHHHRQGLHDHLVEPEQQRRPGGRQRHLEQELAPGAAGHGAGLDDLGRDAADAQDGAAGHGRHGEQGGRQQRRHLAEAEQHDHRRQIGQMRDALQQVEQHGEHGLGAPAARRRDPGEQARHGRQRCRHQHQRQRLHRRHPDAEHGEVEAASAGEQQRADVRRHDGRGWSAASATASHGSGCDALAREAVGEEPFGPGERKAEQPGDAAGQVAHREQAEARILAEPGEQLGDPLAQRRQRPRGAGARSREPRARAKPCPAPAAGRTPACATASAWRGSRPRSLDADAHAARGGSKRSSISCSRVTRPDRLGRHRRAPPRARPCASTSGATASSLALADTAPATLTAPASGCMTRPTETSLPRGASLTKSAT